MKKYLIVVLSLAAMLSACSSYDYYAVSNKPLNKNYRTYAWIPEGQSKLASFYNNDIATDRIVETADQELNKRGLTLDNQKPDILIRYTAVVNNGSKIYQEPVYYNQPPYLSTRVGYYRGRARFYYVYRDPLPIYVGDRARRIPIKEGSIMIDLIDRKSSKVIWRGWAEGEVDNPEKALNQIPGVVANIFKKLP